MINETHIMFYLFLVYFVAVKFLDLLNIMSSVQTERKKYYFNYTMIFINFVLPNQLFIYFLSRRH